MRAFFDARCAGTELSSTRVYVRELLARLPSLAPEWTWHVIFRNEKTAKLILEEASAIDSPNIVRETLPYLFASPVGKIRLTALLARRRCDLYFSPIVANSFLAFGGFKGACKATVVAVHANPARDTANPFKAILKRRCLKNAVANCAAVIVDSSRLLDDISSLFRLSDSAKSRLRLVRGGVSSAFANLQAQDTARNKKSKVILYVGRDAPHKNLSTLVRAFAELRRQTPEPLHLLIVCPSPSVSTRKLVRDLGIAQHVSFVAVSDSRELAIAYRESAMLVSPSGYEGFSLPIVEAMSSGTPIVCCDDASFNEVSAKSALYAPPRDEAGLIEKMRILLNDDSVRESCIANGLRRAKDFSWDNAAAETLAVFKDVLLHRRGVNE